MLSAPALSISPSNGQNNQPAPPPSSPSLSHPQHDAIEFPSSTQQLSCHVTLRDHSCGITSLSFDPETQTLISGSHGGTVSVHTLSPTAPTPPQHSFRAHSNTVWALLNINGGRFITGSSDKTMKVPCLNPIFNFNIL